MNEFQDRLSKFPWATLGRVEKEDKFWKKWADEREKVSLIKDPPKITLVIPITRGVDSARFHLTLNSIISQSYPYWEAICIGDSANVDACYRLFRDKLTDVNDKRLRWVKANAGSLEVDLKQEGISCATGDWVGFVLPEDVISPVALYRLVLELKSYSHSKVDVIYTNEAMFNEQLSKAHTFFSKHEYSWFSLIHFNYIGRFWMARRDVINKVGGLRRETSEHDEHDLFLRLSEEKAKFLLCPFFLYYRREKNVVDMTSVTPVIDEHMKRMVKYLGFDATVRLFDGRIKVTPVANDLKDLLVTVVICFKNQAELTVNSIMGICNQVGSAPIEIILVDNQSEKDELQIVKDAIKEIEHNIQIVSYSRPFNFAHMHNSVIRDQARGKFILFLNNDVYWQGTGTLDEMVSWCNQPDVGTVGISLRYPNGQLQHGGISAQYGGQSRLARIGNRQKEDFFTKESHQVFATSFAACMVRKETFEKVGGLRELEFSNGFGDTIFNFECLRMGLKNIYLGHIQAIHKESASRGVEYEYWEEFGLEREFPQILQRMLRCDLGYNRIPRGEISHLLSSDGVALKRLKRSFYQKYQGLFIFRTES